MAGTRSITSLRNTPTLVPLAAGVLAASMTLAGCSGSGSGSSAGGKVVSGGTFTMALSADPGNLDPQASAASTTYQMSLLAYDPLVSLDKSGAIRSQLATSWKDNGKTVTLTLHKGITCTDGSAFTAQTAADNINYVANPKNASPWAGTLITPGAKATADAATNTVSISLPAPAPFALNGLAQLPMVCSKGLANRKLLAHQTDGTGAYQLSQATPNSQYTLTKRAGYTWGPNGVTSAQKGLPDKIVVKIIPNETTAANLLLSGQLNSAVVIGSDTKRLDAAKLFTSPQPTVSGELYFNQAPGRVGADPKVRLALAKALDFPQLASVQTSGQGKVPTAFAVNAPAACRGNSVAKALPSHDVAQAKAMLDADGWKVGPGGIRTKNGKQLALRFTYLNEAGAPAEAAAELIAKEWGAIGVKVTPVGEDDTQLTNDLLTTGNWDAGSEPVGVTSPDELVPFLSGPTPPKGSNFAHIDNQAYNAGVADAEKTIGSAGCPTWLSAESHLISSADAIPFAEQIAKAYGSGARFSFLPDLLPTSIRMLSK